MSDHTSSRFGRKGAAILLVAALAVTGWGIATRVHSQNQLASWTAEQAIPSVAVIHPAPAASGGVLTLSAILQPLNSAPIHARTTGYLREWFVDIGDRVRRGQVLARLDAPEVEQQLAAARADLQTARANQHLASTTAARWSSLLAEAVVSRQAADEKQADLAAKTAITGAAQANVARLQTLTGFTRLVAPFDGVVTSRSAEIGALVSAGGASTAPLFTIADISRIRAGVRVPQLTSPQIRPGMEAILTLPEYPGRRFTATTTRTAGAVDPGSGTVLVEVEADNADLALKPGSYVQVRFSLDAAVDIVTLPPSALIMGGDGPRVALIDSAGTVVLRPVTLGRDRGKVVDIVAGLTSSDAVINNPPDSLQTGDLVRVAG